MKSATPVPFSLQCEECDAGMDVKSRRSATARGWTSIRKDDGISYNFVGLCPDCRKDQALTDSGGQLELELRP